MSGGAELAAAIAPRADLTGWRLDPASSAAELVLADGPGGREVGRYRLVGLTGTIRLDPRDPAGSHFDLEGGAEGVGAVRFASRVIHPDRDGRLRVLGRLMMERYLGLVSLTFELSRAPGDAGAERLLVAAAGVVHLDELAPAGVEAGGRHLAVTIRAEAVRGRA